MHKHYAQKYRDLFDGNDPVEGKLAKTMAFMAGEIDAADMVASMRYAYANPFHYWWPKALTEAESAESLALASVLEKWKVLPVESKLELLSLPAPLMAYGVLPMLWVVGNLGWLTPPSGGLIR